MTSSRNNSSNNKTKQTINNRQSEHIVQKEHLISGSMLRVQKLFSSPPLRCIYNPTGDKNEDIFYPKSTKSHFRESDFRKSFSRNVKETSAESPWHSVACAYFYSLSLLLHNDISAELSNYIFSERTAWQGGWGGTGSSLGFT